MMNKCPGQTYSDFVTQNYCQEEIDILDDISPSLVIANGTVVNADSSEITSILIEHGVIKEINGKLSLKKNTCIIDAKDMYVMPGGIDPSTHFDFEFMGAKTIEDFFTGTRAAVVGGTTMIIDYVIPKKSQRFVDAFVEVKKKADKNVVCDYGLHLGISYYDDTIDKQIIEILKYNAINSIKVHMGYNELMIDDGAIFNICKICDKYKAICMIHAENQHIINENAKQLLKSGLTSTRAHYKARNVETECEAVFRALTIAKIAKCPIYLSNIMSKEAMNIIKIKKNLIKVDIFSEVLSASIGCITDQTKYNRKLKPAYVRSPPIHQDIENQRKLINGIVEGVFNLTASDDCSFILKDKYFSFNDFEKIPNGIHGVENRMEIIWDKCVNSGRITPSKFVAITSTNAAKIFNVYPQKGAIKVGSDADIVIWNPNKKKRISPFGQYQSCDYNIFNGMKITGGPEYVIIRGVICYRKGIPLMQKGFGKFVEMKTGSKYIHHQFRESLL